MKRMFVYILIFAMTFSAYAQQKNAPISANEQITLTPDTNFPQAMRLLEIMSQKFDSRKILNTSNYVGSIGIPVHQVYWKNALNMIASYNGLIIEELPGIYLVKDASEEGGKLPTEEDIIKTDTKQVRIGSIFFTMDRSLEHALGIDWSTVMDGKVTASASFNAGSRITSEIMSASISKRLSSGDFVLDIDALLNMVDATDKGRIIAKPTVTVMSGKKGYLQVGEDFSIRSQDYSGNVREKFYSTGVILDVTPTVISDTTREVIHLQAKVERSGVLPDEFSTIVNKIQSTTDLVMYDGEETVIAGLYDTEETLVRSGIPFLKDLPWWVLGIRYLTGYNSTEMSEQEIIIIIKAEILDHIDDRYINEKQIKDEIESFSKTGKELHELFDRESESVADSASTDFEQEGE